MEDNQKEKTDWLKALAEDASLWEERAYTEMPAVIAHEYWRLHELALQNNVYGVMLQLKDVYEIILKYPCILGLCIFGHTNTIEGSAAYESFMKEILKKMLSFGDWREMIAKPLINLKDYLPAQLIGILKKTHMLVTSQFVGKGNGEKKGTDVVNWRNDIIGHGALRLDEDDELKREIRSMLERLKEYFGQGSKISIYGQYDSIVLKQNQVELIGAQAAELKDSVTPFSIVIKNDMAFSDPIEDLKYILPYENKICFFDTYMKYKKKSKYLDYVAGHLKLRPQDFFYELYKKLVQDELIRTAKDFSTDVTNTDVEKLLVELETANHFHRPDYVYDWMVAKLQQDQKGCYMLRMGRGMGKTSLSAYLDGRYNGSDSLPIQANCLVRTYHCSRNQLRGINDFVTSLNYMFMEEDHLDGWIKDIEGVFETIRRDEDDRKATAKLLNSCAKYFKAQGKKVVLVVDGVDEIVDGNMFDYFPVPSTLDDGVYIFYTSRPDEELPAKMRDLINGIGVQEIHAVTADDAGYQKLVLEFAKEELRRSVKDTKCSPTDSNISAEYRALAEKAGFNFLKLRMLIPVYCSGNGIKADTLNNHADIFAHYIELLNDYYGDKFYRIYVKPLLVNLAIFYDGLTFGELAKLADGMDTPLMLLAILNDLKAVLSVERSERGNIYLFANEEYVRYIREIYAQDVLSAKQTYVDELREVAKDIRENFGWADIKGAPLDISHIDEEYLSIRNYIKQAFPRTLLLREKLFHVFDINSSVCDAESLLNMGETYVDFLQDFLLVSKCAGYDFQEFIRSADVLLWAQEYTYYLSKYSQQRPEFRRIGLKLAWCFIYLQGVSEWLQRTLYSQNLGAKSGENGTVTYSSFVDMFKLHLKEMMAKQIFKDDWEMFRFLDCTDLLDSDRDWEPDSEGNVCRWFFRCVMQRNELPLFIAHEKEFFSIFCRLAIFCEQSPYFDDILSEFPDKKEWRAWGANMKLNRAINLCDQFNSYSLQWAPYDAAKEIYESIIALGGVPRYIPYTPTHDYDESFAYPEMYRDSSYFNEFISFLRNDDRKGFFEMHLREVEEEKVIDRAGSLFDVLGSLSWNLLPDMEDEYQLIATFFLRKATERKEYLEKCLDENLPVGKYIDYPYVCVISEYLALSDSDFLKDYVNNHGKYTWYSSQWILDKHAKQLKQWLDRYAIALLSSDSNAAIYFAEFYIYFKYMVKTDQDQLYDDLMSNRLYLDKRDKNFVSYLMFCVHYAKEKKNTDTAKRLAHQFIKEMVKYRYKFEASLMAWIVCQQLLLDCGEPSEDPYAPIRSLQKELQSSNYMGMIESYCSMGICSFMLGDLSSVSLWVKEIDKVVTEAEQQQKESNILNISEQSQNDVWLVSAIMELLACFLMKKKTLALFQEEAKAILRHHQESDGSRELGIERTIIIAMLIATCKHFLPKNVFDKMASDFNDYYHGLFYSDELQFSFLNNRFYIPKQWFNLDYHIII